MTNKWFGIFKLGEEIGELQSELAAIQGLLGRTQTLLGKLGPFPSGVHPDGAGDLKTRLEEELADVAAAIIYFTEQNELDGEHIDIRAEMKLERYRKWGLSGVPADNKEKVYGKISG